MCDDMNIAPLLKEKCKRSSWRCTDGAVGHGRAPPHRACGGAELTNAVRPVENFAYHLDVGHP